MADITWDVVGHCWRAPDGRHLKSMDMYDARLEAAQLDNLELGSGTSGFEKITQAADASLLEVFENPCDSNLDLEVQLGGYDDPKEFTSLCPKTGQPDFARIVVRYSPNELCVESKSWKLYLGSYRSHQGFHESCVSRIAADLVEVLKPKWISVTGQFTPRGGISINPQVTWSE